MGQSQTSGTPGTERNAQTDALPSGAIVAGPLLAIALINPVYAHDKDAGLHPGFDCAEQQDRNAPPSGIFLPEMDDAGPSFENLVRPLIGAPTPACQAPEIFLTYPGNSRKHTQKYPKD